MLEKIRKTEFPIPGFKRFRGQLLYGVAGRSIGHCPKGEAFMAEQSTIRACAAGVRRANRPADKESPRQAGCSGGQTQNRTADTRIFSPLLYQLSYLAVIENAGLRILQREPSTEFFMKNENTPIRCLCLSFAFRYGAL